MTGTVEVSVIIPCYKMGAYLPRFVSLLKAQDFKGSWEAVFVDDGDPQGASVYTCVDDPRFRVVRRPNGGLSAARNTGLAQTSGEIILFADPDDEVGPSWITHLVAAIDGVDLGWAGFRECRGESVRRVVAQDVGTLYGGSAVKRRVWRAVFGYRLRDLLRWLTPHRLWTGCGREFGSVCWRAFRRSVIGALRFDESLKLYEDALFLAAYAERAQSMRVVGETDYDYYLRPTGMMAVENRDRLVFNKFLLRDARAKLDPHLASWRGTFLLSALEVARAAGLCAALRYLLFKPFDNPTKRNDT